MPHRTQYDDKIRNLLDLARDDSVRGRTLLFSHICDLFLQNRPMHSEKQIRMLLDILRELLPSVELSARQDIAALLINMDEPPVELIKIFSEDVTEVSRPVLEQAIIPDDHLIHLVRYGDDRRRYFIARRFGLSPLVRQELERHHHGPGAARLKFSLNDLAQREARTRPALDEEITTSLFHLLKSRRHQDDSSPAQDGPAEDTGPRTPADPPSTGGRISRADLSRAIFNLEEEQRLAAFYASDVPATVTPAPGRDDGDPILHMAGPADPPRPDAQKNGPQDKPESLSDARFAEPETPEPEIPESADAPQAPGAPPPGTRPSAPRDRDFIRASADWFWETDRTGVLQFLSEEAFTAFGRPAQDMIGEDFISLCRVPPGHDNSLNLEALFERRSPFRDEAFTVLSRRGDQSVWLLSGVAVFDIQTGRFTGFRGSARSREPEQLGTTFKEPSAATMTATRLKSRPVRQERRRRKLADGTETEEIYPEEIDPEEIDLEESSDEESDESGPEKQDRIASELLQNLSHEFRTPLNAIIGFSEMIDMEAWGPVNPKYRDHTRNILEAANRLKEAVNDVLDSAKLDSGLIEVSPESFSLKSIITGCEEKIAALLKSRNIHIVNSDRNIDVILYNDRHCLEMCLCKMITSAVREAPDGEELSLAVLISSNAQVRIEVPLLGQKIPESQQESLFDKIKKEPDSPLSGEASAPRYEPRLAPGYGLSVARDLARLIGGDLKGHCERGYVSHLVLTVGNYPQQG